MLACYNPKKQTMLQTDASIKGLDSCLLQEEKPVYFASKTPYRSPERICGHRDRTACSGLGNGEIPSIIIWQSFYHRN